MAMDKTKDEEKPRLKFKTKIYKGVMLLENEIEEIENMEIHDDDIWVCSYPRSGESNASSYFIVHCFRHTILTRKKPSVFYICKSKQCGLRSDSA